MKLHRNTRNTSCRPLHVLVLLIHVMGALGHTRFECPPPRSAETGAKTGPCDAPDDLNLPAFPLQPNALNTITWLESISHPGAPGRIALSMDGSDNGMESCVLLDHIPHDEYSFPNFVEPTTYHRSSITLWIPDVYCERCTLQLITFMTDEVHGVPENATCAYEGAQAAGTADPALPLCPVVYHSCAPVSINGTIPRNDMTECNTTEFETQLDWPFQKDQEYSTYYYKGNPGMYNQTDSRILSGGPPIEGCDNYAYCDPDVFYFPNQDNLVTVPADAPYRALEGSCAAIGTTQVEPFVLGALPQEPKNLSVPFVPPMVTPCSPCDAVAQCFTADACVLRDSTTGNWTGPVEPCNAFAGACEECYTDSPCYLGGGDEEAAADGNSAAGEAAMDANADSNQTEAPEATTSSTMAPESGAMNRRGGALKTHFLCLVVFVGLVMASGLM